MTKKPAPVSHTAQVSGPVNTGATSANVPQPLGGFDPTYQAWRTTQVPNFGPGGYPVGPNFENTAQTGPSPRYYDGAQFEPMSWSVDKIIDLQSKLHAAGLLDKYRPGVFSTDDITAYTRLLAFANGAGTSADEYLNYMTSQSAIGGEVGGTGRQPLTVVLKNDNDLKAVLQTGAQALYGKFMSQDDVNKFISSYHAQETAYQTEAYNQQGAAGGTVQGPPTTESGINRQFEEQFAQEHPTEARTSTFMNELGNIISALTRSGPSG